MTSRNIAVSALNKTNAIDRWNPFRPMIGNYVVLNNATPQADLIKGELLFVEIQAGTTTSVVVGVTDTDLKDGDWYGLFVVTGLANYPENFFAIDNISGETMYTDIAGQQDYPIATEEEFNISNSGLYTIFKFNGKLMLRSLS